MIFKTNQRTFCKRCLAGNPSQIWNCAEIGLSYVVNPCRAVSATGRKYRVRGNVYKWAMMKEKLMTSSGVGAQTVPGYGLPSSRAIGRLLPDAMVKLSRITIEIFLLQGR
jgi:hypothetical protein